MTEKNHLLLNIIQSAESPITDFSNPDITHSPINDTESKTTAFEAALKEFDITSIFDIIRQPKSSFCQQLAALSEKSPALKEVNAELTYDHAMCYAIQIGRLYREQQTSSPDAVQSSPTGTRALIEKTPDYPSYENLFKEKWGEFCKVGAISAIDSPVAYLTSLYRLITTVVEPNGEGITSKIPLDARRPDLKELVVNQQTTFTPLPMLTIVNEVLSKGIEDFLGKNAAPLNQQLAEKRHPFVFPYHFAHHQCQLGLAAKNHQLGEINYRIARILPTGRDADNGFGNQTSNSTSATAQALLSGLSPQQQSVITEPTLFSDFYLSRADTVAGRWISPGSSTFSPWQALEYGYVLPKQSSIKSCTPDASALTRATSPTFNTLEINFTKPGSADRPLKFHLASHLRVSKAERQIHFTYRSGLDTKCLNINFQKGENLPTEHGYKATFHIVAIASGGLELPGTPQKAFMARSFTISLDDVGSNDYLLTDSEQHFFKGHYGVEFSLSNQNPLIALDTFMDQSGLNADTVEALLALRRHAPKVSANCQSLNPLHIGVAGALAFPYSSHYGAGYVNGVGAWASKKNSEDYVDNSLGLKEVDTATGKAWHMTNTSLQRFDRLQRMIRLQRWMNIPFAELDTLIVAAIRAEGEANLTMALNDNTLRTLGVFRYLSQRYGIKAEEFAAFLYYLSPYADGDRTPLFDEVFNSPALLIPHLSWIRPLSRPRTPTPDSRRPFTNCAPAWVYSRRNPPLNALHTIPGPTLARYGVRWRSCPRYTGRHA
ncbi:Tc toxin subunit A [Pseudomonas sp. NA-150]|uniref:Tc toxin subunit A n=1 Tax=Pseudomonas sp. NA-150 TaxID=3367525 RepID=UPI0037C5FE29